jgi:glucosamine-6-phosphate deaminase
VTGPAALAAPRVQVKGDAQQVACAAADVVAAAASARALTMGLGTLRAARAVPVLATGESKASAVRALVHGPEDPEWPCSFLGRHPDLTLLADRGAARSL